MKSIRILITALIALTFLVANDLHAQRLPKGIKVANEKRPNDLKVTAAELNAFYKALFGEEMSFKNLKMVKSELAYYLLADCTNDSRIFAFELKQRGKKLCLDPYLPVQSCDKGELQLRTFLEIDGKLNGCKLGEHKVQVHEKN
ncbi:MAG: hypothetical protein CMN32_09880 [Saprospirales bacterium]|nr:hypothetical protein [Saprospirales bacterium]